MSMTQPGADIREGEQAVPLPSQTDAGLYFIGRVNTPWRTRRDCPKNAGESDAPCTIVIDRRWAEGLKDLESATHVIVLYWMHEARRDLVLQSPKHYGVQRGTFSLRSPARPNPIALSVSRLMKIEDNVLTIAGIDCIDGTAVLDIKPYFASVDSKPDASVGWHRDRKQT
jgi:tRNA-Thr(GGU) m(6)t(6)A37 methyltransferase TsaA